MVPRQEHGASKDVTVVHLVPAPTFFLQHVEPAEGQANTQTPLRALTGLMPADVVTVADAPCWSGEHVQFPSFLMMSSSQSQKQAKGSAENCGSLKHDDQKELDVLHCYCTPSTVTALWVCVCV